MSLSGWLCKTYEVCHDANKGSIVIQLYSLFNLIYFRSKNRNGTCYTSSECTSKGGTASGNCAAG